MKWEWGELRECGEKVLPGSSMVAGTELVHVLLAPVCM